MRPGPTIGALVKAYPTLPRSERRVADFILEHPQDVPNLTSTEVGKRAGVSQSIVSRLCQRVYEGGYGALRMGLAQELAVAQVRAAHTEGPADQLAPPEDEIQRRTAEDLGIAERAVALLDRDHLRQVAQVLIKATNVVVCGMSLSGAVGQRLAHLLYSEGLTSRTEREPYHPPYWSLGVGEGSVLVVVSYRGQAPELAGLVQYAKEQGAQLVLITNEARSPLAVRADVVLATHAPAAETDTDYASGVAMYVQLAAVRALWLMVRQVLAEASTD